MSTLLDVSDRKLSETQPHEIEAPRAPGRAIMGRPSRYSDETAAEICERIADGQSVKAICSDMHMPCRQAVHEWIASNRNGFGDMFARACEARAEHWADEIVAIADGVAGCTDNAAVNAARLQIDTRKWIASKLLPRRYGDRIGVDSIGSLTVKIIHGLGDE